MLRMLLPFLLQVSVALGLLHTVPGSVASPSSSRTRPAGPRGDNA